MRDNSASQIDPMIKRQNAHQMKSHEYNFNKQIRNSEFECSFINQVHLTHHMVFNFPTYCCSILLVWQLSFCFVPALPFSSSMQESLAIILSSCTLFRAFLEHVMQVLKEDLVFFQLSIGSCVVADIMCDESQVPTPNYIVL